MQQPEPTPPSWLRPLFPARPRDFPYRRPVRLVLRTAHILAAGTLLGGVIFNQPWPSLEPWWLAMLVTGVLLLLTDLHASCGYLLQISGLSVLVKIGLSAVAGWMPQAALPLLLGALVIGSITSHMPGRYRHRTPAWARAWIARSAKS